SATHRACRPSGTPPGSGGLVSQPNSVTQNPGAPWDLTCPARQAERSSRLILGRSPSEASCSSDARWFGPPLVYGSWAQMANESFALQVACGREPPDMQRSELM